MLRRYACPGTTSRQYPGRVSRRAYVHGNTPPMRGLAVRSAVGVVCACLVLVGCGDDGDNDVERARSRVKAEQDNLADAQEAAEVAATEFCDQARDYITALDRYGDVLPRRSRRSGTCGKPGPTWPSLARTWRPARRMRLLPARTW